MKLKDYLLLFTILLLGLLLRTFAINWDNGTHMQPDERAITLYALPLHFPTSLQELFLIQSPLNPHFFAYGTLPLYILKASSVVVGIFDKSYLFYDKINILGRFLSALFDTATAGIVFLIGKRLFHKYIGFTAAFCYTLSVLPIQLSHFFAVDTFLTFFITLCLYLLILYYQNPSLKIAFLIGICFGLGIATKNSAIALIVAISLTITADFLLIFLKQPHKPHIWFPHVPHILKVLFTNGITIALSTVVTFAICEPYTIIDFKNFWMQTQQQYQMTHDTFTFPYTLQFVGKTPYIYELKNIFFWGLGPILTIFSVIGAIYFVYIIINKKNHKWASELILVLFFFAYYLVVGKFAIGFMRYMLPIYPLLTLFAAVILYKLSVYFHHKLRRFYLEITYYVFLAILLLLWPISFMHIYTQPNSRISASQWIYQNISSDKTLAIEHWDDQLPFGKITHYNMFTFPLYDQDTPEKWSIINAQLSHTDYIILASNRLSAPLQRLTDCQHLPPEHCYPLTASYYKNLFNGQLGFTKIAEFSVYPTIPFLNIPINDQTADESFTVFDHPKIMIFKKTNSND